ncbi:MAG: serine/threonine protein kinase [Elusimicrobia bacterium]|nr:serine/threonine protein kinase [Elusimicrobiota bacterium]
MASDPLIGTVLGPCRIEEFLSRGGMGNVYRGRHLALDREVALKIIEPPMVNGEQVISNVVREARASAKLEHPRVVQVYDVGQQGPYCYIVLQLARGETLERLLARRRFLNAPEALRIMKDVLAGLAAAHGLGIVHRDIKPGNVMVDDDGSARIMDFGISGAVGADAQAAGTVDFMAPEQAYGAAPDPRTDLYACGVVYYHMLTGKLPYPSQNPQEAMLQHRDAPIPDIRDTDPSVTTFAAALISRLMAKTPDARPATADEVLKALESPEMLEENQEAAAAAGREAALPPPPPVSPRMAVVPTAMSQAIFVAIALLAFGRQWLDAVHADWLAGGVVCALLLAAGYLSDRRGWRKKTAAAALFVCMCLSFYKFGLPGRWNWVPAAAPSMEVFILLGLGLAAAMGSLWEGVFDEESRSLELSLWLLLGAVAGLGIGGACLRLSGSSMPWLAGMRELLVGEFRSFAATHGVWRWTGVAFLYAGSWVFFPKRHATVQKVEGRVIGYA